MHGKGVVVAMAFQIGDRVRMVRHDDLFGYRERAGQEAVVTRLPNDYTATVEVIYIADGVADTAFPDRFDAVAPTTPRLFKKGDRVRVVKFNPQSNLNGCARLGDIGDVGYTQRGEFVQVKVGEARYYTAFYADQFELVTEAAAPTTPEPQAPPLPPTSADAMLRLLDRFLSRNDEESQRLQRVLSALRGPDEFRYNKAATTIPIRRAALPECARKADKDWFGCNGMDFHADTFVVPPDDTHFTNHICLAADALRTMGREVV